MSEDPFANAQDWYVCSECDTSLKGFQELNNHIAAHHQLREQAKQLIYPTKSGSPLIRRSLLNNNTKQSKISNNNQEYMKNKALKTQKDFLFSELKKSMDVISKTRNKPFLGTNLATSKDILNDFTKLKNDCINLQLNNNDNNDNLSFLDKCENRILTNNKKNKIFKQPNYKKFKKNEINMDKNDNNNNNIDENNEDIDMDMDMNKEFIFDVNDFQIFLDANSEILGRLQNIRKEKSFYGVTQEEIDLAEKFTDNVGNILEYGDIPGGFLI